MKFLDASCIMKPALNKMLMILISLKDGVLLFIEVNFIIQLYEAFNWKLTLTLVLVSEALISHHNWSIDFEKDEVVTRAT